MGIVVESSSIANAALAQSLTITKPTGTVEGDLLLAFVARDQVQTITPPSGWTLLAEQYQSLARNNASWIGRRVAGASEPADYTWSDPAVDEQWGGGIIRISGVHADVTDAITVYDQGQNDATPDCPSITTNTNNAFVFCFAHLMNANTTSISSPKTEIFEVIQQHANCYAGYYEQVTAGATGTVTVTFTGDDGTAEWQTYQVALKSAAGVIHLSGSASGAGTATGDLHITRHLSGSASGSGTATAVLPMVRRLTLQPDSYRVLSESAHFLPFDLNGEYCWAETFEAPSTVYSGYDNAGWSETEAVYVDPDETTVTHSGHGNHVLEVMRIFESTAISEFDFTSKAWSNVYLRFYFRASIIGATASKNLVQISHAYGDNNCFRLREYATNQHDIGLYKKSTSTWQNESITITAGVWHHVCLRYDGVNELGQVWFDGVALFGSPVDIGTTASPDTLGAISFRSSDSSDKNLYFDDVLIRQASEYNGPIGDFALLPFVTDGSDNTGFLSQTNNATLYFGLANPASIKTPKGVTLWARIKQHDSNSYLTKLAHYADSANNGELVCLGTDYKNIPVICDKYEPDWSSWDSAKINALIIGLRNMGTDGDSLSWYTGAIVTDLYAEVIHGDIGDAWCIRAPYFGGCTSTQIRCYVKVNEETDVKLRYGESQSDVLNNTGTVLDTDPVTVTSDTDFSTIFTINNLDPNTTYHFDVLVQQSAGYYMSTYVFEGGAASEYWATLPQCKTLITEDTSPDFKWACGGDQHPNTPTHHTLYENIADDGPAFFFDLGDQGADAGPYTLDDYRRSWYIRRGFTGHCLELTEHLSSRMPMYHIPSDHCVGGDNSNKIGTGVFEDASQSYEPHYNFLKAFKEMVPFPDLSAPSNYSGTSTGGSTTTLQDSNSAERQLEYDGLTGGTPAAGDDITIGGDGATVLYVDATDGTTGTMIVLMDTNTDQIANNDAVTNGTWTCYIDTTVTGIYNFPTESKYGIYHGQVVHWNPGDATGAWGEVYTNSGTTLTFHAALTNSKTFASPYYDYEIYRGGIWYEWAYGNCHFISFECRSRRDPDGTPGGDKLDGTAYGAIKHDHPKDSVTAGTGTTSTHIYLDSGTFANTVKWDMVYNATVTPVDTDGETAYSLVKTVHNSTHVELEWAIANQVSTNSIKVFESGASDHGIGLSDAEADKANINHGHVVRTFVESTLRDSTREWRFLVTETPLLHAEAAGANDKWCDYDGNVAIKATDEINWLQDGVTDRWYYNTPITIEPGGIRRGDVNGKPGSLEQISDYLNLDDVHEWAYDAGTDRVYIYTQPTTEVEIYQPNFSTRCASRKYIVEKYESLNAIWLGADRHFAALDDASHELDPWPHVAAAPLHVCRHRSHTASRGWKVGGKYAMYDRGSGRVGGADPPAGVNQIGAYCVADVKNSESKINFTLYERDGGVVTNAHMGDAADWLGNLTMDVDFITRVTLSENLGMTDALDWTKILPTQLFSESVSVTDQQTWLRSMARLFSESVSVTDQQDTTQAFIRFLSDNEGLTDSDVFSRVLSRYVSDSTGITDDVKSIIQIIKRLSESMGIADDLIGGLVIGRLLSDSLGLTDAKTRHSDLVRLLSEAQGVTDDVATTASYIRTLADSLAVTDIDHPAATFDRKFSESLGITDALVDTLYLIIVKRISEAVGISDARLALRTMAHVFSDGIDITDAREKFITIVRLVSELGGLSDGLTTAQDHGRKVSDDAGVTDVAKGLLTIIRLLSDSEGLSDAAIGEITAAIIERALSESVGISDDAVEALFALFWKLISDNEGIADNAEVMQTLVRRISELSVGITDAAAKSQTLIRALSDTQAVADAVAFTFTIIQKISDQVGVSDRILGQILAYAMYKLYLAGSTAYMEVTPTAAELVAISLGTRDYMQFELETFDSEVAR